MRNYSVPELIVLDCRANFYDSNSFEQYAAVNRKFAEAIISQHQKGDISACV